MGGCLRGDLERLGELGLTGEGPHGNWLIAVATEATGPDATADPVAGVAPADTEIAELTARALVDRGLGPDSDQARLFSTGTAWRAR